VTKSLLQGLCFVFIYSFWNISNLCSRCACLPLLQAQ